LSDWKRNLKKEEKRKEIKYAKEGRKNELEKFRKAEIKLESTNSNGILRGVKKDITVTENAIGKITNKFKKDKLTNGNGVKSRKSRARK